MKSKKKLNEICEETKARLCAQRPDYNLRQELNDQYDELTEKEQKELNLLVRWEFVKPVEFRIPKKVLMAGFKEKQKTALMYLSEKNG
tara:strand:+ start:302 stop:565 length:264 start_codon:yes stop_codon:yes gene_type:complete